LIHPARITPNDLPAPPTALRDLAIRLNRHVHFLAGPELAGRKPGTPGNRRAAEYLLGEFEHYGLLGLGPENRRTQLISPAIGHNVFSALGPVLPGRDWLVVGAHFDHLGEENGTYYLGADDNASGVAILLETARLAQDRLSLQQYNLMFVAFNSEESPYFLTQWMGSHHFVHHLESLGIPPGRIAAAVIMDLMGGIFWKPLRDTVFIMGSEKSPELESVMREVAVHGLKVQPLGMHMIESVPTTGRMIFSDYQIFREYGIPFVFLSSGRNPDYHRPTDTAGRLHYARMARSTLWLLEYLETLDRFPRRPAYHPKRERYAQDLATLHPLIRRAAAWKNKIPESGWISLYQLNRDEGRLQRIERKIRSGTPPDATDARALSLASIRLQCLLGNMGPCFLMPGQTKRD